MDFLYNTFVYYTIFNATYYISSLIAYTWDKTHINKIQETNANEIQMHIINKEFIFH